MTGCWALRGLFAGSIVLVLTGADANLPIRNAPEKKIIAALKVLFTAQIDFRANDREGNWVSDYWTGDIAGLYYMTSAGVKGNKDVPIRLIDPTLAAADAAPLQAGAASGEYAEPRKLARFGYYPYRFRVMTADATVTPSVPYQQDTGGRVMMGRVHSNTRFGFCGYSMKSGGATQRTFIVNEKGVIYGKNTGGKPVLEWPGAEELKSGWTKVE